MKINVFQRKISAFTCVAEVYMVEYDVSRLGKSCTSPGKKLLIFASMDFVDSFK